MTISTSSAGSSIGTTFSTTTDVVNGRILFHSSVSLLYVQLGAGLSSAAQSV
jgi:hypothetical protein